MRKLIEVLPHERHGHIGFATSMPGVLCNIWYPSETHRKLGSHKISFAHNLFIRYPIVLKFCTEHGVDATLCKISKRLDNLNGFKVEWDFARLEFKMSFGRTSHVAQQPCRAASHMMRNNSIPDNKVHGANMGPIWGRQDPGGPHVGPIRDQQVFAQIFLNIPVSVPYVLNGYDLKSAKFDYFLYNLCW